MLREIEIIINSQNLTLLYNVAAMFKIQDILKENKQTDENQNLVNLLLNISGETLPIIYRIAAVMSEQGELSRRYQGYDQRKYLTYEELAVNLLPYDFPKLQESMVKAILAGYGREVESEDDEGEDLSLQKFEKKTEKKMTPK